MDGTIAKINATLLDWLGVERDAVLGRQRFVDLLTVGGKLYHETHYAPLLRMQGDINGIAMELRRANGDLMPVLVSSVVKYGESGDPLLIRTTLFDARDRRAYEEELLRGRKAAEEARKQAEADRARLQDALAVLQKSLLPDTLPQVPGVETAAYYHIASPDRLGGDFYDVFPLDGERFAFFLGDVCDKGPQAAAVTSLTRYTLRAAALHDADPAAALTALNTVLHDRYTGSGDPPLRTTVFGILTPGASRGRYTVRLASGGHPPAVVLGADGTASYLPTPGGLLVGVLPDAHFATAETVLTPGDRPPALHRRADRGPHQRQRHQSVRGRGPAGVRRRPCRQVRPRHHRSPDRPARQLRRRPRRRHRPARAGRPAPHRTVLAPVPTTPM